VKLFEFKEFNYYTTISNEEILEMANISPNKTGIKDVFIWIGPNPHYHGKRIKVSNIPNKFSKDNCFTITIPEYKIIGDVNSNLIKPSVYDDIIKFIKLNLQLISDYSDEKISTDELIDGLKKI